MASRMRTRADRGAVSIAAALVAVLADAVCVQAQQVCVCIAMDGSGSIPTASFELMKDGFAWAPPFTGPGFVVRARSADGAVTIDELIAAVQNALLG